MITVSASILNSDFSQLAQTVQKMTDAGANHIHFDVMDGCFVDNLSFGLPVLKSLRHCTTLPIDAHLMIVHPLRFVKRFAEAGANLISFHLESDSDAAETLQAIHHCGCRAGIALCPETPAEQAFPLLPLLQAEDFILLMTVHPGQGGQAFLPEVLPKLKQVSTMLSTLPAPIHLQVDGGIHAETAAQCREAGADILVAGSYLLHSENPKEAVACLRGD